MSETYPDGWLHATIHLNPDTGEIHSDGDHRVRFWLLSHLKKPWRQRFRLGPNTYELSGRWFAFCLWNGDTAWITLPFVYFGAGTKNIELGLGQGKWHVTFDIRWRWD